MSTVIVPPLATSWNLETVSSFPSFLRDVAASDPTLKALDFFQADLGFGAAPAIESADLCFLYDLTMRILHRGTGTLPDLDVETAITVLYGGDLELREKPIDSIGCVEWQWNPEGHGAVRAFCDWLDPWEGNSAAVDFDPSHPENERKLFDQLVEYYGERIASSIYTQVQIADLLPEEVGKKFLGQRIDFLLAFPNGRCVVLEPGDHDAGVNPVAQANRDRQRDKAFAERGIGTLRIANDQIGTTALIQAIDPIIEKCGAKRFLCASSGDPERTVRLAHLVLMPTLLARLEHVLAFFLLRRGMLARASLRLCISEQDLECAEIALFSFLDRLRRLSALYRIPCPAPKLELVIVGSRDRTCADLAPVRETLAQYGCTARRVADAGSAQFDLAIDVAIKSNHLTAPRRIPAESKATVRNAYPHSRLHRFHYSSLPRPAQLGEDGEQLITSFLGDFFRKRRLREGQLPIIRNILAQKATIGLLPTSAGKSICYQLASLLTPGITLVVDPIVFLMRDQVLSLSEQYGITKVVAWHAEAGYYRDEKIGELMAGNIMVFMSPERFLRPTFRSAMQGLMAGDLYVNYAVVDEAHCVSMWGHDFRPPYLMLERCFRQYCSSRSRNPVVIALTGTASQLVLIDLKRELGIEDYEAIVRPKSFDRAELTYNVVCCPAAKKGAALTSIFGSIAERIGVRNVRKDAWGMLFAHYPKQVWELYSQLAGETDQHIVNIAANDQLEAEIPVGIACRGMPKQSPVSQGAWKAYKDRILPHFKRGKVRLLIGNAAVGVGIDNEFLSYVIAYCTPSSLESLGQQWGRAGRRGQPSQCYLIYSDDQPQVTDQWLNGRIDDMPRRYDDLGTVSYFHAQSFPGEAEDINGILNVIRAIWSAEKEKNGRRPITGDAGERRQRYLSFLIMMGIAEDYEVTGIGAGTQYHVLLHPAVEEAVQAKDEVRIKDHVIKALQKYLSRYRPITRREIEIGLDSRLEERLSGKTVGFLVHFIYDRVAYQRKESIRTIVMFCRDQDLSPVAVRRRLKAFFDRNPKFSDRLDAMADMQPAIKSVMEVSELVEGYDDAEHLYWETRRLLDERYRADWAAINLYAILFREKALSESGRFLLRQIVDELRERLSADAQKIFLAGYLGQVVGLDRSFGEPISSQLLPELFNVLYARYNLEYLPVLDDVNCASELKILIRSSIAAKQVEDLLDVVKHKHRLGGLRKTGEGVS